MLGGRSRPGSLVPTPLGSKMKHDRRQGEEPNWFQPALGQCVIIKWCQPKLSVRDHHPVLYGSNCAVGSNGISVRAIFMGSGGAVCYCF